MASSARGDAVFWKLGVRETAGEPTKLAGDY